MATKEQCEYYDQCGFVRWRAGRVNNQAQPLPENGDCGIKVESCARINPGIPIPIGHYGPYPMEEMEASFLLITNDHGRPPKRIEGGGNR
ncbi:MAG: hypothetical protein UX88_C0013G0005 [Candidatus Woesebacteria bacterium GW2011_GWC2_47_16]|uniref:Uncharacterized protein n=7 Tax=Candidatus Woeseibacteriota TaxID=1752722 RepID=A0A0G1SK80_9BACT|nr:MAG: hypothetical protein UX34_C0037G0005 [Candidatus Woesebacteria bacterium GW2011_GWF1_46_13]KKU64395.1 MAG: hypothetical protein UX88_C0013G0005 [Candidatus Woesebacteria bacterium GW2011_GWC2_47_16]KKU69821.1 MAG: hypothetical protein UX95_C0031G0003 [Candidatus Woesebacteria bacterium GW2011_GWD1_47_21]OGM79353.1 MAG: hypothetical protein A2197_00045 [Candidatus Woesebacteria bacterium RIFOXYA1_FULL_48_16]OGM83401.1 MAG: hypothetical protein A2376_02635 [Candidatus Woesebacteria bacter